MKIIDKCNFVLVTTKERLKLNSGPIILVQWFLIWVHVRITQGALKSPMPRLLPTPIKSEYRGWGGAQASIFFFKARKQFQWVGKVENLCTVVRDTCPLKLSLPKSTW